MVGKDMFNCKSWIREADKLLKKLYEYDHGYPLDENIIESPDPVSRISDKSIGDNRSLPQVKEFYSLCDGIDWPNVYNGHYIIKKKELGEVKDDTEPTFIEGVNSGEVLFFGSSGGGDLFVIIKKTGQVAILPYGGIEQNVYDNSDGHVRVVADDFYGFLTLLLEDLRAYVNEEQGHTYLIDYT